MKRVLGNIRLQRIVNRKTGKLLGTSVLGMLALVSMGCGEKQEKGPEPHMGGPVEVGVIEVKTTEISLSRELPGRTSAFRIAEVRARVSGIVLEQKFEEGSEVKEGDVLYQIDPAPYQATLDSATATLARAEASQESARLLEERYQQLLKTRAISQQDYDNALAAYQAAKADVAAAKAAITMAEINLGYTKVVSPINGRIGLSEVTEGAYVQQAQATLLATVQQLDPLYVDLTQSSSDIFRLRRAIESGEVQGNNGDETKLTVVLEDGSSYGHQGVLKFSDVSLDPSTSSITIRAILPNPDDELLPGLFVRARIEEGTRPNAILLPQMAITYNQKGEPYCFIVNAENQVEIRDVRIERAVGNQWLIQDGVKAGEKIIVQNLQRIQPGAEVTTIPATNVPEAVLENPTNNS